jgi:hypothetical protein
MLSLQAHPAAASLDWHAISAILRFSAHCRFNAISLSIYTVLPIYNTRCAAVFNSIKSEIGVDSSYQPKSFGSRGRRLSLEHRLENTVILLLWWVGKLKVSALTPLTTTRIKCSHDLRKLYPAFQIPEFVSLRIHPEILNETNHSYQAT